MAIRKKGREGDSTGVGPVKPSEALTRHRPALHARSRLTQVRTDQVRYAARVANIGFLIPAGMITEIVETLPSYPVPNTAHWFSGLANMRGNILPVFDLRGLFGGTRAEGGRFLVMDKGDKGVAIPIDDLPSPVSIAHRIDQLPALPDSLAPHVRAAYLDNKDVWLDVNFPAFFEELGTRVPQ